MLHEQHGVSQSTLKDLKTKQKTKTPKKPPKKLDWFKLET